MKAVCPQGFICLNNYNLMTYFIIIIVILFFLGREYNTKVNSKLDKLENKHAVMNKKIEQQNEINLTKEAVVNTENININPKENTILVNKDYELIKNPLLPPVRRNYHIDRDPYYTAPGVPINIPTRGYMGDYQQVGMLYKEGIENTENSVGNNNETNILPLYGKPLYSNSSKWLYYTSSDKFNSIKIPINHNNRDCSDDYGCNEIYDGDIINVPAYNGNFKVKIYKYDKPRYLPFII